MTNEKFFNIGLPKWPCLLVTGKKVTPTQATMIIIRTDDFRFFSNDHELEAELKAAAGMAPEPPRGSTFDRDLWEHDMAQDQKVRETYGLLDLEYLHNDRIVSAWVGGPHGWCDWDGTIFSNTYNIGKWPSVEEVYKEWVQIAQAFPFLDLRCQLLSGENCEDSTEPVVEFTVIEGLVTMSIPTERLTPPCEDQMTNFMHLISGHPRNREFGTTIPKFKEALRLTKEALDKFNLSPN